jgi:hypothetical protein
METKIKLGEITPDMKKFNDLLVIDSEGTVWQLLLFMGISRRFVRLKYENFAKWLVYHDGEFKVKHIALSVPIYVNPPTEER